MQPIFFKLGSDPELMLREITSKKLRSAIPVITEGKGCGRPLDDSGYNCVLHDNVLIEFNTLPAGNKGQFVKTIGGVLKSIDHLVKPHGLELWLQTSADFPAEELASPEAIAFGCEPDFDAYKLEMNEIPAGAAELPFRSAGGHLHVGFDERNPEVRALLEDDFGKIRVVKALDIFVGIPSIFIDKDPTAKARRSLYGKAGCHRPKTYGVEYRASGPWWLASPAHTDLVYRLSAAALCFALDEKAMEEQIRAIGGEADIQDIINTSDTVTAEKVYDTHICHYLEGTTQKLVAKLNAAPVDDFRKAWRLDKR